jgi:hypothetical protein
MSEYEVRNLDSDPVANALLNVAASIEMLAVEHRALRRALSPDDAMSIAEELHLARRDVSDALGGVADGLIDAAAAAKAGPLRG